MTISCAFSPQSFNKFYELTAKVLSEDAIDQYPKIDDDVAEHFIPEVTLLEEDFIEVKDKS